MICINDSDGKKPMSIVKILIEKTYSHDNITIMKYHKYKLNAVSTMVSAIYTKNTKTANIQ